MLFGCCHCPTEPPAGSSFFQSSFSDSTSSGGPATTIHACSPQRCLNDEVPLQFTFEILEPSGTSGICKAYYYGQFTVFYTPSTCYSYASAEYAKENVVGCPDVTTSERWSIGISTGGGATTTFALTGLLKVSGSVLAIIRYSNTITRNTSCVRSLTLNKQLGDSLGYKWPATVTINPS